MLIAFSLLQHKKSFEKHCKSTIKKTYNVGKIDPKSKFSKPFTTAAKEGYKKEEKKVLNSFLNLP